MFFLQSGLCVGLFSGELKVFLIDFPNRPEIRRSMHPRPPTESGWLLGVRQSSQNWEQTRVGCVVKDSHRGNYDLSRATGR